MNWKTQQSSTWIAEKFACLKHTTMAGLQWVEAEEANEKIRELEIKIGALSAHYNTIEMIAKSSSQEAYQLRETLNNITRPK